MNLKHAIPKPREQRSCRTAHTDLARIAFASALLGVLVLSLLSFVRFVSADPAGTQITFNSSTTATATPPGARNDSGGTLNTLLLNTLQQDSAWKAYLGNVTGSLTLDDPVGNTIYNWALLTISGKVYASRSNSITWANINCSNQTYVDSEQTALSFASSDSDSINRTFNSTNHQSFLTAARNMTGCRSTATFVNDTRQAQVASALFQEVLLSDGTNSVYATLINTAQRGFNNQSLDFQMIVPQSKATSTPTQFYFYVELS